MVGGASMSDAEDVGSDPRVDDGTAGVDIPDDLREHLTPVDDVYPYPQNAKAHPDEQIDDLVGRIRKEGWDVPIVTDEGGEIVKGHGRLRAAKRLDMSEVPVVRNSYETEADKRAARLADNRVAESEWVDEHLGVEVDYLDEVDYDVGSLGFDDDELEAALEHVEPPSIPVDEHERSEPSDDDDEDEDDEVRVVVIANGDDEADTIGEWAHENGFEWHIVDA